jgi:hypothetical protein
MAGNRDYQTVTKHAYFQLRAAIAVIGLIFAGFAQAPALRAAGDDPANPVPLKAYAFRVNTDGLILDTNGAPVAASNVFVYLKSLKIPNIPIVCLWIDGPDAAKHLAPTIQGFGGSFTKIIVKQWDAADKTGLIDLPAPTKQATQAAISAAYPGRAYPKASVGGPAVERPGELRPGAVPAKVHYQYADNATVEEAAQRLARHFLDADDASKPVWAANVVVQSGAWSLFDGDSRLGKSDAIHFTAKIPALTKALELPQVLLRNSGEISELDSDLRRTVAAEGGATVRALQSDELKTWWQYIPYDITEPVFVLETRNGGHRFVVGMNLDGIAMIDELNGLPSLSKEPLGLGSN